MANQILLYNHNTGGSRAVPVPESSDYKTAYASMVGVYNDIEEIPATSHGVDPYKDKDEASKAGLIIGIAVAAAAAVGVGIALANSKDKDVERALQEVDK